MGLLNAFSAGGNAQVGATVTTRVKCCGFLFLFQVSSEPHNGKPMALRLLRNAQMSCAKEPQASQFQIGPFCPTQFEIGLCCFVGTHSVNKIHSGFDIVVHELLCLFG